IMGAFSDGMLLRQRRGRALNHNTSGAERIFCLCIVLMLTLGILLSGSRGGWIGTTVGTSVLLWLFSSFPVERRSGSLPQPGRLLPRFALAGCFLLLVLALFFIGPAGRGQVDIRIEQTVTDDQGLQSLQGRVAVWPIFMGIVRDFPVFGIGLGAWPELW